MPSAWITSWGHRECGRRGVTEWHNYWFSKLALSELKRTNAVSIAAYARSQDRLALCRLAAVSSNFFRLRRQVLIVTAATSMGSAAILMVCYARPGLAANLSLAVRSTGDSALFMCTFVRLEVQCVGCCQLQSAYSLVVQIVFEQMSNFQLFCVVCDLGSNIDFR